MVVDATTVAVASGATIAGAATAVAAAFSATFPADST